VATTLALLAEASPTIGTGHVVETRTLMRAARARGDGAIAWVSAATPPGLLATLEGDVRRVPSFDVAHLSRVAAEVAGTGARAIVTNVRCLSNEGAHALAAAAVPVICVDEWGNRALDCDAVVNATPVPRQHVYTSANPRFQLHTGLGYLPIGPEYLEARSRAHVHAGPVTSVVVAMGGVDRTAIAVRLAQTLVAMRPALEIHLVLGAGFTGDAELAALSGAHALRVHRALPTLAGLLAGSDVGFTVGGNTLLEMACVGTPGLTLYEEPHEREQSEALAALGFGRCLGPGTTVDRRLVAEALAAFDDPRERTRQAAVGQMLVDGRGAERVLDLVTALIARRAA